MKRLNSSAQGNSSAVSGVSHDDLSREELCAFTARMAAVAGPTFADGDSIAEYAETEAGPSYWDDPEQRAEGPEECADSDISYWED